MLDEDIRKKSGDDFHVRIFGLPQLAFIVSSVIDEYTQNTSMSVS